MKKNKFYPFFWIITGLFICACNSTDGGGDEPKPPEPTAKPSSIKVEADPYYQVGATATFAAKDNFFNDVSDKVTFFVNDNKIDGKTYTPTEVKENKLYAKWDKLSSPTLKFKTFIKEAPDKYTTKVLLEDYTGTWCGYCPGMAFLVQEAVKYNARIIPIAIYTSSGSLSYEFESQLRSYVFPGVTRFGWPTGLANRTKKVESYFTFLTDYPDPNNTFIKDFFDPLLNKESKLGLAINSSLNEGQLTAHIKVGFALNKLKARLSVCLLEDDIVATQANFYPRFTYIDIPYSHMDNPIPDYKHHHILRKIYPQMEGESIPEEAIWSGLIYEKDIKVAIPDNYNPAKLHIVAFVTDAISRGVINMQAANVGENKDFD